MLSALLTAVLLASPASPANAGTPTFDYDHSRPLDVASTGVVMRDIAFAGASGGRIEATVVEPTQAGRHPAVLFAHWYEEPALNSNRTEFVPDALRLARSGVVSLLVDTMWSDPKWFSSRNPADDFASSVAQVENLRRALDVLASLDDVDARRMALVGHDFGAMYGSLAAGVDRRVKALVFIAGTRSFADWFLLGRKLDPATERAVRAELAPLDPVAYVGRIAPAPVLFQFATKDPYVTKEAADALVAAAGEPKSVKTYEAGHGMNIDALEDRVPWLLQALQAKP